MTSLTIDPFTLCGVNLIQNCIEKSKKQSKTFTLLHKGNNPQLKFKITNGTHQKITKAPHLYVHLYIHKQIYNLKA